MTAEQTGGFFHSFESPNIPDISWQEVLEKRILIPPKELIPILNDAQEFLSTAEGPNSVIRSVLAQEWFGWWKMNLNNYQRWLDEDRLVKPEYKLCPFNDIKERIEYYLHTDESFIYKSTGLLNVAGAEGHAGHIAAAYVMSDTVNAIWAFEQDSYFKHKLRPAPFLPLQVRLWMWAYSPLSMVTVNPEMGPGDDFNVHYKELFDSTGIDRSFSDEIDPNVEVKIRRGKPGINGFNDNKLRHTLGISTTECVKKLLPDTEGEETEEIHTLIIRQLNKELIGREDLGELFIEISPKGIEDLTTLLLRGRSSRHGRDGGDGGW